MSSYLKLSSHPSVFADAILMGQKPKEEAGQLGLGTNRNVIKLSK